MKLKDEVKELAKTTPFTESDIASSLETRASNGFPLNLNLQFFAEDPPSDPPADPEDPPVDDPKEKTPEEIALAKKIEAESDRKLESAKQKWEVDQQSKIDKAVADAVAEKERLSKLSEKERKEEELSQREKDIANRLAKIEQKELKADALSDLSEKGFPSEYNEFLADTLLAEDAKNTLEKINKFKEMTDKMLNQMVKEALRQDTPPAGGGGTGKGTSTIAELRNKQDQKQNKAPDIWA